MGRILSIDYGERHIGLALSDETKTIAQGLATLEVDRKPPAAGHRPLDKTLRAIAEIVASHEVELIILGHPLSMSGKESRISQTVRKFKAILEKKVAVPVELVDERFTTSMAHQYLSEAYPRARARRHAVDKIAATILLEDYLARQKKPRIPDSQPEADG